MYIVCAVAWKNTFDLFRNNVLTSSLRYMRRGALVAPIGAGAAPRSLGTPKNRAGLAS